MKTFKVGDKVRRVHCTEAFERDSKLSAKDIHTIESIGNENDNYPEFLVLVGQQNKRSTDSYDPECFELVESASDFIDISKLSVPAQLELAKKYVGKIVKCNHPDGNKSLIKLDDVTVHYIGGLSSSIYVNEVVERDGICITMIGCWSSIPFLFAQIPVEPPKPTTKILKLNASYDATITKDTVKVGCQTFPISIIEQILAESKKL